VLGQVSFLAEGGIGSGPLAGVVGTWGTACVSKWQVGLSLQPGAQGPAAGPAAATHRFGCR
jgi:hypothetical protein